MDFFELLSTKFTACSKPPSRDNYRKASYPRTQQRDQQGWQYGTVRRYGTVRLNFCQEVRYAFFVMVRVRYVGTVRLLCDGTGTVRWYAF